MKLLKVFMWIDANKARSFIVMMAVYMTIGMVLGVTMKSASAEEFFAWLLSVSLTAPLMCIVNIGLISLFCRAIEKMQDPAETSPHDQNQR